MKFKFFIVWYWCSWLHFVHPELIISADKLISVQKASNSSTIITQNYIKNYEGYGVCPNDVTLYSPLNFVRVPYLCQEIAPIDVNRCLVNQVIVRNKTRHVINSYNLQPNQQDLIFQINNSGDEVYLQFRQNSAFPHLCNLTDSISTFRQRLGSYCETTNDCLSMDKHSECRRNRCECASSYCYLTTYDKCVPCYELGEQCTYPESLQNGYCRVANSICKVESASLQGICRCGSRYVQIGKNCWPSMNAVEENYQMAARIAIASAVVVALAILLAIVWNTIKNRIPDARSRRSGPSLRQNRASVDSINQLVEDRLRNRPPAYSTDTDKPPSYEESINSGCDVASDSGGSSTTTSETIQIYNAEAPTSPPPEYGSQTPVFPSSYLRTTSYENSAFVNEDNATTDEIYLRLPSISNSIDNNPLDSPTVEQSYEHSYL